MLRKILCLSLCFIFAISICACGDSGNNKTVSSNASTTSDSSSSTIIDNESTDSTDSKTESTNEGVENTPIETTTLVPDNMPIISINTADGSNSFVTDFGREEKLQGLIDYVDATITVNSGDENFDFSGVEAEVKVRGNYTLTYDKKPIRIKFSKKQSMLGLHNGEKYKNWVLLADWKDLSMTNNALTFYLGKHLFGEDGYYCSDFRYVEVYINNNYWGVYLLAEQQEVKDGRFTATEVEDNYAGTDIGYMFEFDGYYTEEQQVPNGEGDPTFTVNYNDDRYTQIGYTVKSDIYSSEQLEFIQNFVENTYHISKIAINDNVFLKFDDTYTNVIESPAKSKREAIGEVIDLQSLVDIYILQEIAKDPDIAWSSFYMSVDMSENGNKKLVFEAPWDFDSAYGIKKKYTSYDGLFAADSLNPWLSLLAHEDWFIEMVKDRWNKMTEQKVQENALKLVLEIKEKYTAHFARNYDKWKKRALHGNGELIPEVNAFRTQGEAADYLHNWLSHRFQYLDSVWGNK